MAEKEGEGEELRSMEQLVLDMCQDIKPELGALISQQYASHVIRVLLCILAGKRIDEEGGKDRGRFRSKNSRKFRQSHDPNSLGKVKSQSISDFICGRWISFIYDIFTQNKI